MANDLGLFYLGKPQGQVRERLEKHFLCSIQARAAKLYAWGFTHEQVIRFNLEGAAFFVVLDMLLELGKWGETGKSVLNLLSTRAVEEPLPEGIPE